MIINQVYIFHPFFFINEKKIVFGNSSSDDDIQQPYTNSDGFGFQNMNNSILARTPPPPPGKTSNIDSLSSNMDDWTTVVSRRVDWNTIDQDVEYLINTNESDKNNNLTQ